MESTMETAMETAMETDVAALRHKLNSETGRIAWPQLQRHFARGVVIHVSPQLDLVEVACHVAMDARDQVAAWMDAGGLGPADARQAADWHARNAEFWAVVTAPWVLIQECRDDDERGRRS